MMFRSAYEKLQGPLVPVMPAFHEDESVDYESTCRWVEWLVGKGIKLFWTTYGTSHFMSLTDEEVLELTRRIAEVTRGRAFFIASTHFHWPYPMCATFLRRAAEWGVDAVKVQIDWRWDPDEDRVYEFMQKLNDESPLPLLAYTIAGRSTNGMTGKLLQRIVQLPKVIGMKNDSGDFYEQCDYLRVIREAGAEFTSVTGGSLSSFLHGSRFGARAYATTIGMYLPQQAIEFTQCLGGGRFDKATEIIIRYEEAQSDLMKRVPFTHWAVLHTMLKAAGHFASDQMRFPLRRLDGAAAVQVEEYAERTLETLEGLSAQPKG